MAAKGTVVELTSGGLRWVPAAASARQPARFGTVPDGVAGLNSGVRASISARWPMFDFMQLICNCICDHENDIGPPSKALRKCFMLVHDQAAA